MGKIVDTAMTFIGESMSQSFPSHTCGEFEYNVTDPVNVVTTGLQQKGKKYSQDKLDYTLIPPYALEDLARHLTVGLRKYPDRENWRKVPNARQEYLKAAWRHFNSFNKGVKYDPDGKEPDLHELMCVVVNLMFYLEFELNPNLEEVKE